MQKELQLRDGKIVLSEQPLVLETPLENLGQFITPTKLFYVRNHFPIPEIDRNKWRLRVEGEVEKPFEINFDELTKLESKEIPATLECAGNGRSFLEPKVKGVQWNIGGVSNAAWTGVPLSTPQATTSIHLPVAGLTRPPSGANRHTCAGPPLQSHSWTLVPSAELPPLTSRQRPDAGFFNVSSCGEVVSWLYCHA